MSDLKSRTSIIAKGVLFLVMVVICAGLILMESLTFRTGLLVVLLIWASARFYYFLFYVLEHYVDSSLKYSGVLALIREIWSRSRGSTVPPANDVDTTGSETSIDRQSPVDWPNPGSP